MEISAYLKDRTMSKSQFHIKMIINKLTKRLHSGGIHPYPDNRGENSKV